MMIKFIGGPHDGTSLDLSAWNSLPPFWYRPIETDPESLVIDDHVGWRPPDAVYRLHRNAKTREFHYVYERTVNYKPE